MVLMMGEAWERNAFVGSIIQALDSAIREAPRSSRMARLGFRVLLERSPSWVRFAYLCLEGLETGCSLDC